MVPVGAAAPQKISRYNAASESFWKIVFTGIREHTRFDSEPALAFELEPSRFVAQSRHFRILVHCLRKKRGKTAGTALWSLVFSLHPKRPSSAVQRLPPDGMRRLGVSPSWQRNVAWAEDFVFQHVKKPLHNANQASPEMSWFGS